MLRVCAWLLGKVFFLALLELFLFVQGIFCLGLFAYLLPPFLFIPPPLYSASWVRTYVRKLTTAPPESCVPNTAHALFTLLVLYIPAFFLLVRCLVRLRLLLLSPRYLSYFRL